MEDRPFGWGSSALRRAVTVTLRFPSSTTVSVQTRLSSSFFVTTSPRCSTRTRRRSKAFGVRGTSSSPRQSTDFSVLRRNGPNSKEGESVIGGRAPGYVPRWLARGQLEARVLAVGGDEAGSLAARHPRPVPVVGRGSREEDAAPLGEHGGGRIRIDRLEREQRAAELPPEIERERLFIPPSRVDPGP